MGRAGIEPATLEVPEIAPFRSDVLGLNSRFIGLFWGLWTHSPLHALPGRLVRWGAFVSSLDFPNQARPRRPS